MSEERIQILLKVLMFAALAFIIAQFYPSVHRQVQFSYEIGKPWRYDLLTAEFDFPVYKTDEVIERERTETLEKLLPYLRIDTAVVAALTDTLMSDTTLSAKISQALAGQLEKIYATGVMPSQLVQHLADRQLDAVMVLRDEHSAVKTATADLYTQKSAYETLSAICGSDDSGLLRKLAEPNLVLDELANARASEQAISQLSLTSGVIQAGEQIINRGDIVTPERYQVLKSLQRAYDEKLLNRRQSVAVYLAEAVFAGVFLFLFFLYLYLFRPAIFNRWRSLLCLLLLIVMWVGASAIMVHQSLSVLIIPFAFVPIVVRLFFDSRTGLFTHWIIVMLTAFMVPEPMEFCFLQVAAGMTAVSTLKDITQRSQLGKTSLMIFIVYAITYCALEIVEKGALDVTDAWNIGYLAVSSLMILTAYGFIFILEKMFGFTSSITLVELTNVNSDFMLRFAEQAPGTFQHSLQVSNLATEAAKKINANSLLVRTGALYHDIGKLAHPEYFTENQNGGHNVLNDMQLTTAAQTVIQHVDDGIELAQKEGLPQAIINFIATHHGTSRTRWFYNTYANQHPGEDIDPRPFTYPGPMPDSKETGILMMADAVEAASRSLKEYTEQSINDLVEKIVGAQVAEGQLANTPLSFRNIEDIKAVFKDKIKSMYHNRIAYPELKSDAENDKSST